MLSPLVAHAHRVSLEAFARVLSACLNLYKFFTFSPMSQLVLGTVDCRQKIQKIQPESRSEAGAILGFYQHERAHQNEKKNQVVEYQKAQVHIHGFSPEVVFVVDVHAYQQAQSLQCKTDE